MNTTKLLRSLTLLLLGAVLLPSRAADVAPVPLSLSEAAFAAELVDEEWSGTKEKEIEESLSGISDSAVECKASICRVELTWENLGEEESWEQFTQRIAKWTQEVSRRAGFAQADTDFRPDDPRTVSYFSVKPLMGRLPPGLSPAAADAFGECLGDSAERFRRQAPAEPATLSAETCEI